LGTAGGLLRQAPLGVPLVKDLHTRAQNDEDVVRIRPGEIGNPQKPRGKVDFFRGIHDGLPKEDEDGKLEKKGQASAERVHLFLAIELHKLLL